MSVRIMNRLRDMLQRVMLDPVMGLAFVWLLVVLGALIVYLVLQQLGSMGYL